MKVPMTSVVRATVGSVPDETGSAPQPARRHHPTRYIGGCYTDAGERNSLQISRVSGHNNRQHY